MPDTVVQTNKSKELLENLSQKTDAVVPGVYVGIVEISKSEEDNSHAVKVRIPEIDLEKESASLPMAKPIFSYAGHGYGMYSPCKAGSLVYVAIVQNQPHRAILGYAYNAGEVPSDLSNSVDGRSGKTVGLATPSGHKIMITDTDDDNELEISLASGYKFILRGDKQLPDEEIDEDHSLTPKRGILIETPNNSRIEIDENDDKYENHNMNVKFVGKFNQEISHDVNIKLTPYDETDVVEESAPRQIKIEVEAEVGSSSNFAKVILDTNGNTTVNASGDITLSTPAVYFKLSGDAITITANKLIVNADVEIVRGKLLQVYNAGVPIVINEHTHTVIVNPNIPPPMPHPHLTTMTSPTP